MPSLEIHAHVMQMAAAGKGRVAHVSWILEVNKLNTHTLYSLLNNVLSFTHACRIIQTIR